MLFSHCTSCHTAWTWLLISVSDIVTSITDFRTRNFDPFIYLHQHIFLPAAALLSWNAVLWIDYQVVQEIKHWQTYTFISVFCISVKTSTYNHWRLKIDYKHETLALLKIFPMTYYVPQKPEVSEFLKLNLGGLPVILKHLNQRTDD